MSSNDVLQMLVGLMPSLLRCFGSRDIETANACVPFFQSYLRIIKKLPQSQPIHKEQLRAILTIVREQVCLKGQFETSAESDDEDNEATQFREGVSQIHKAVVRADPQLTMTFLSGVLDVSPPIFLYFYIQYLCFHQHQFDVISMKRQNKGHISFVQMCKQYFNY
jgi:hypothetical protein